MREKEAQIKKDLNDGIDTVGGKMTVCTESHNLSILGNLYRQTRHLLESVMIYR